MVIISASRRSDIPALYADWFEQQLRQGWVTVKNPYNARQIKRVSLKKENVEAFIFWTRYPRPLFHCLDILDEQQIPYYFLITINNYPSVLEPRLPEIDRVMRTVDQLSRRIGRMRIIWRYDPIVITEQTPASFHRENFSNLLHELSPCCHRVIVSTIDFYAKVKSRFQKMGLRIMDREKHRDLYDPLLTFIRTRTVESGLEIQGCAEKRADKGVTDIPNGKCIDNQILNRLFSLNVTYDKDKNQRPLCRCHHSVDIGSYNTCSFGCLYCYAR